MVGVVPVFVSEFDAGAVVCGFVFVCATDLLRWLSLFVLVSVFVGYLCVGALDLLYLCLCCFDFAGFVCATDFVGYLCRCFVADLGRCFIYSVGMHLITIPGDGSSHKGSYESAC